MRWKICSEHYNSGSVLILGPDLPYLGIPALLAWLHSEGWSSEQAEPKQGERVESERWK